MNTRFTLISAAIAGTLAALASSVPYLNLVNCLLCGWLWLGGIFAVWIYRWNTDAPLDRSSAMILGTVTGLFASAVSIVITAIEGMNATPVPPETMDQLRQALGPSADLIFSQGTSLIVSAIFTLIFYTLFAMLGGLLGSMIFKSKAAPQVPQG